MEELETSATQTVFVQRVTYVLPPELIYKVKDVADAEGLTDNLVAQIALEEYIARLEKTRGGAYPSKKRAGLTPLGTES